MDPRTLPLLETLRLNTRLALNCLDGMSEEQARGRPGGVNSAAFIAAHLANARHFLLKTLGAPAGDPLARYLDGKRGIDEMTCSTTATTSASSRSFGACMGCRQ